MVRGGTWLFLSELVLNATVLARSLILIRLLDARDFGLWAAIVATTELLKNVSDAGIHLVAVQHREGDSPEVLATAWWLNALRGLVLSLALLASAPLVALSFADAGPRLPNLLRLVSLVFLMEGFSSAGIITATRRLTFHRLVLVQHASALVSVCSAIVLGLIFRNVMALVLAEILRGALLLILSYVVLPVRPSLAARLDAARDLWRSGKHLYMAKLAEFLVIRGPIFVLGRLVATTQIGLYHLALSFGMMPWNYVAMVVNRVVFPAFAKMQDDAARLGRALLQTQRFLSTVAAPMCLGIVALVPAVAAIGGRDALTGGLRYGGMVLPAQLIALGMYVTCVTSINTSVMLGLGHAHAIRRLRIVHLLLVAAAVVPLTKYWGIRGAAALAFFELPIWFLAARHVGRHVGGGIREQIRNQGFIVAPAAAMAAVIGILWYFLRTHLVIYAVGAALLSPAAYLGALRLTAPDRLRESVDVLKQALGRTPAAADASVAETPQ